MTNQVATVDFNQLVSKAMESSDIAVLERMLDMQERVMERNAKSDFISAMTRFQNNCPDVKKLKQGHNYKYAPLDDIISQVRGLMTECGLSYRFEQSQTDKEITVSCIVTHLSGHSETTAVTSTADTSGSKNAVQAIGATITYLRRYSFTGAFGIVTADQDSDARLTGQAMQEHVDSATVMQIYSLIESTETSEAKVKEYIRKANGWPADSDFEIAQLNKQTASAVLSMLKKKAASK